MRHLHLAVATVLALTISGCACKSGGEDDGGNLDGGFDAGPKRCETHADCATEGASVVCDPQEKVCMPKCTMDSQCMHVASGVHGGNLDPGDADDPRRPGRRQNVRHRGDRVVVGHRHGRDARRHGLPHELSRRRASVGRRGMEVEIDHAERGRRFAGPRRR